MNRDPSVLVTDDDEDIRLLCQVSLELEGFGVLEAANGAEALRAAERDRPDVILLDLMMPVMDGWECLQQLKADPRLEPTPVVVITGKVQGPDQERAMAAGAAAYVTKPFEPDELATRVRAALEHV